MPRGRPRKQELDPEQELAKTKAERDVLKAQLAAASTRPVLSVNFITKDTEKASLYADAGGRLVTCEHIHKPAKPGMPVIRPGKKFGFHETEEELEALVKKMEEETA